MSQTRLLQIVNDKDEFIGHVTPDERRPEQIYRVSSLWLTNSRGRVLVAQRHPDMTHMGGKWGPAVAGTVEAGETYLDNIRKETAEELGVSDLNFSEAMKVFQPIQPGRNRQYFCQWYYATCDWPETQFTLEPGEVAAVRWMGSGELKQDIENHPERYIPSAKNWIGRFI